MQEEGPESKKKEKKKRKMYQEHPMGGTWKSDQQRRNRSRKAWSESQEGKWHQGLGRQMEEMDQTGFVQRVSQGPWVLSQQPEASVLEEYSTDPVCSKGWENNKY